MPKKDPSFEDSYRQLDEIVRKLEAGGLPLEYSVILFEEGMLLAKLCGRQLEAAELRITQVTTEMAQPEEASPETPL